MGNWNCGQERLEAELRESGEKERKRAERSTRLPVLVKCCVLSEQQPRMCQPSRLTLPNGLLNADIKLARSFTLPFSSLAPSFSASATCSHYLSFSPCPSLCHSLVLCLSFTRLLLLYQPLAVFFFFFFLLSFLSLTSSITSSSPPKPLVVQVVSLFKTLQQ